MCFDFGIRYSTASAPSSLGSMVRRCLFLKSLPEPHRAGDFGDDRVILRPARLEQLRHARQTARDVAGLGAVDRDARDDVARAHRRARLERDDRFDRQQIARVAAARQLGDLAVLALDDDRRLEAGRARRRAPIDDDALGDAGRLVDLLRHRGALDQILEADHAVDLGQDRPGERIPLGDALAALDLVALVDLEPRAILHAVHRALGAAAVGDDDRDVARHRHQIAVRVAREVAVADLHLAVEVRLDERLVRELRRAADVEGAHRELRARLADRLRGDDADRLAHIDRRAAREIAPVAGAADAVLRLAGQDRADLHLLDAGGVDRRHVLLDDHPAGFDDHLAVGVAQRLRRGAAENARSERRHHRARVDDRAHADAARRAAIGHGDDRILRDVDETARQIARVRGLQRGVREALAGAVGRVEVFENRQALLEVGDDRALDDLARRLGHQAAHGGELAHLRRRTARARNATSCRSS